MIENAAAFARFAARPSTSTFSRLPSYLEKDRRPVPHAAHPSRLTCIASPRFERPSQIFLGGWHFSN